MTSTSETRPSGLWVSVPTVCRSVVQEEFLLKTFAVEEEHVLTQERIMGQKGNLIALAGICEFHYSYFKRLWFNGSLNTGTSAHFKIDFLKCRRLHAQLPQTKQCRILYQRLLNSLLTKLNESLWPSLETNFRRINYKRLIGLKITWLKCTNPKGSAGRLPLCLVILSW